MIVPWVCYKIFISITEECYLKLYYPDLFPWDLMMTIIPSLIVPPHLISISAYFIFEVIIIFGTYGL